MGVGVLAGSSAGFFSGVAAVVFVLSGAAAAGGGTLLEGGDALSGWLAGGVGLGGVTVT